MLPSMQINQWISIKPSLLMKCQVKFLQFKIVISYAVHVDNQQVMYRNSSFLDVIDKEAT